MTSLTNLLNEGVVFLGCPCPTLTTATLAYGYSYPRGDCYNCYKCYIPNENPKCTYFSRVFKFSRSTSLLEKVTKAYKIKVFLEQKPRSQTKKNKKAYYVGHKSGKSSAMLKNSFNKHSDTKQCYDD